jgi:hypothetical protein
MKSYKLTHSFEFDIFDLNASSAVTLYHEKILEVGLSKKFSLNSVNIASLLSIFHENISNIKN